MGFSNLGRSNELRLIWVWMWVCGPQGLPAMGGFTASHRPRSRWVAIEIEDSSLAKSGLPWRNSGYHFLWVRRPLWMSYQYVSVAQAKPTPSSCHKFHTQPCQWCPAFNSTCTFMFQVSFTPSGLENSSIICLSLSFILCIQSVTIISWSLIWNKSWISLNLYYFLFLN